MNWKDGAWKADTAQRWAVALLTGGALVVALAFVAKLFVESVFDRAYEIHWLETVPLITLLFAFVLQSGWKKDAQAVHTDEEE